MIQNASEKIAENLDFVKASHYTRGSGEAVVGGCLWESCSKNVLKI